MKPTDIRNPDVFHKVVDCQWACPAHTPVPEYIRLIAAGVPLFLFVVFTLLMVQLRSFSRSVMVLLTAPLGLIGVTLFLLVFRVPFGFVAMLGTIALAGMIMRNSVILVDLIEQDIKAGHDRWNAVVDATVRRFRPIVLTALAAILAMIPLSRSAFFGPMAVAIMGGLTVATVLTLLMVQLRSFPRTLLVLLTAPLGLIGVVLFLLVSRTPFGFVAMLGTIALAGMIMRNSVILVDQIEQDIAAGHDRWHAIIEATVRRFRPIVLTALAAILAMIPLSRSVFFGPMAVAIMGGLTVATALTLVVLPALYAAWFRVRPEEGDARPA